MQRVQRYFMFYVMAALVAGCASLGVPPADTFSEKLAAGYSLNAQVRATATELLNAKKISSSDGQNVMDQTNNFRAGLDIARTMAMTNLESAESKLNAVRNGMTALQSYLASRKGN